MLEITTENLNKWIVIIFIVLVWSIPWKTIALWKTARKGSIGWFLFFVLFNTLGIVEILYLYLEKKQKNKEQENNFSRTRTITKG